MVEPTHLKNILVKLGIFPQIGMNMKNTWNQHPDENKGPPKIVRNILGPKAGSFANSFLLPKKNSLKQLTSCQAMSPQSEVKQSKKVHSNCEVVRSTVTKFWGSLTFCILRIPVHFKQLSSRIHPTQNKHVMVVYEEMVIEVIFENLKNSRCESFQFGYISPWLCSCFIAFCGKKQTSYFARSSLTIDRWF